MKFTLLLPVSLFLLAGCISIKAPENLISDTVKASGELYHSVKNGMSKDERIDSEKVFRYSYEIPKNESLSVSKNNCSNAVAEEARKSLNKYNLNIKQTQYSLTTSGGKDIVNCSISI